MTIWVLMMNLKNTDSAYPRPYSDTEMESVDESLPVDRWQMEEKSYRYQLLGRLKSDCEYYLGNGNRFAGHLWALGEKDQLETMKALWLSFPEEEKPGWLTWEHILAFQKEML